MMIKEILYVVLITFAPFLELRASIPYGVLVADLNPILVFVVAVIVNILLGLLIYALLDYVIRITTKIKIFNKFYLYYVTKVQNKIHKYVEKYGELGLALFIGIPLPGSGVYSGALAAYLLGMSKKKFLIASVIGVLIAGIIVTIVSVSGLTMFNIFIKHI